MDILTAPHPLLLTVCRPDYEITRSQIEQMFSLMRARNGLGLAAPQVGINARVFVTNWNQVFVNPVIVRRSLEVKVRAEGCLSLPGLVANVPRHEWIELKTGERFTGLKARCIQHELDHLNGILIDRWPKP